MEGSACRLGNWGLVCLKKVTFHCVMVYGLILHGCVHLEYLVPLQQNCFCVQMFQLSTCQFCFLTGWGEYSNSSVCALLYMVIFHRDVLKKQSWQILYIWWRVSYTSCHRFNRFDCLTLGLLGSYSNLAFFSRDAVSDLALHFLAKMKIMVVKDIEREDVEFVCKVGASWCSKLGTTRGVTVRSWWSRTLSARM